ncbi:MAG: hypothetical protein JSS10_04920 [Verrucomicrobia bacterium]|nr:hypothetical protein [Verrucomicrobiota bacterium]
MQIIFLILALGGMCRALYGEIWVVEQDFIQIDKKQVYEMAKKEGFSSLKQPQYCFYDSKDREYTYLVPFADLNALESYREKAREPKQAVLLSSILNFTVSSLQELQPTLSYGFAKHLTPLPYAAYLIYTVLPEAEKAFRDKLRLTVLQHQRSAYCWGVWKVLYGAELPKYVLWHFASDEKSLEAQLKAVRPDIHSKWVRRQEEGRAILVPLLSST